MNVVKFLSLAILAIEFFAPLQIHAATVTHNLELKTDGTVLVDTTTTLKVKAGVDVDNFTWVALDSPGQSITEFTATLTLPKPVTDESKISHKLLGIKGVGFATSELVGNDQIVYRATNVGPSSVVSVIADFPKGYLSLPAARRAGVAIQQLNQVWIYSSLLIPLLGLLFLVYMYAQRLIDRYIPTSKKEQVAPPNDTRPALISILYENRIEPEAIASMLVDLARRGFISIFNKGNNFIFAKEKEIDLSTQAFAVGLHDVELNAEELKIAESEGLKPFEKILLSKLFVSSRPISSKEDVKVRIGHGLFSKKVAAIYEYLFRGASELGFFVKDAVTRHRKYLLTGWILFAVGFVGFLLGVWKTPDPKYFIAFWAGLIALAYLVIKLAPYVPLRTSTGRKSMGEFLKFRDFLAESQEAPKEMGIDEFFEYLPHAWALRVHHNWAKRFEHKIFHRPDWYYTSKKINSSTEFVDDIDNLIDFVAESFAAVREKTLV